MNRILRISAAIAVLLLFSSVLWAQTLVSIPQVSQAPVLDGVLSPGEWDNAAVTTGFKLVGSALPAQAQAAVFLCYDEKALYLGWDCTGEAPDKLIGTSGPVDSPVWKDSAVELFLANPKWPVGKYAHFMVNYVGTIADEMGNDGTFERNWNPDWQVRTSKTATGYSVEMAIPWKLIDVTPQKGLELRANLARSAASIPVSEVGESGTWSRLTNGFHQPGAFGTFKLAGDGQTAAISQLPLRAMGNRITSAKLSFGEGKLLSKTTGSRGDKTVSKRIDVYNRPPVSADISFGTKDLIIQVKDSAGKVIWSQSQAMNIPDIMGKYDILRHEFERANKMGSDFEHTFGPEDKITHYVQAVANAMFEKLEYFGTRMVYIGSIGEMETLSEEMDVAAGNLTNVSTAIDFLKSSKDTNGKTPSFYITNPVSTHKVLLGSGDIGPAAKSIKLAMIKNEFEPIQIVVCSSVGELRNVRVSASSLTGPDGVQIPAGRLNVTPIAFVNCKGSTPGSTLKGRIPDVLMPNKAVNIPVMSRQPFFITVRSLATDKAGNYTGKISVVADGTGTVELPLKIRIYDVTLPVKSSLRTVFLQGWGYRGFMDGVPEKQVMMNYSKTFLEHRLTSNLWNGTNVEPVQRADGTWDYSAMEGYLNELVPLGLTTYRVSNTPAVIKAEAEYLKKHGLWDLQYLYGWDEASPDLFGELQKQYKSYLDAVPDLKIMQTGWNPSPKLQGYVKTWCPLTATADMNAVRQAQKAGEEVWWYVCCGPIAPYANLFVDYQGINHRMLGWQTFQYDITGFLYWGLDVWQYAGNTLPLDDYMNADYANWNPQSFANFNGDGYLCYPGKKGTAVPSMRLALLRDGFEDCDMLVEARKLVEKSGKAGSKLQKLITIGAPVSKNLTEFTLDGNVLLKYREKILLEMERVQKSAK